VARVIVGANIQRHVECPPQDVQGATVAEALEAVFAQNNRLRSYVLDDQGEVRKHMNIFVDGALLRDRVRQSDKIDADTEIHIIQALSGG
jgi:molybdopterin converting factor small subunit